MMEENVTLDLQTDIPSDPFSEPMASVDPLPGHQPNAALSKPLAPQAPLMVDPQGCSCQEGNGDKQKSPFDAFVYALGSIEARFPSLSVEKEFTQAVKEGETINLTD